MTLYHLYPYTSFIVVFGLVIMAYALLSASVLMFAEGAYLTYFGIFLTIQLWQHERPNAPPREVHSQSLTQL